jgi:hypothetical protein
MASNLKVVIFGVDFPAPLILVMINIPSLFLSVISAGWVVLELGLFCATYCGNY